MTPREATLHRTALLESALHYARRGWAVFPLHSVEASRCSCGHVPCGPDNRNAGKHPRWRKDDLEHGFHHATTDETIIRQWWGTWPDANLGIRTGAESALVVVDIDQKPGADERWAALVTEHGAGSPTPESLTGSGGRHLLFAYPGVPVPSRDAALGFPGVDCKADGGYIVAPPSRHRSGRLYEWELSSHPDEVSLAPLPAWLLGLLTARSASTSGNGHRSAEDWATLLQGAPEGQRHDVLRRIAGHLLAYLPAAEVTELLLGWAARCRPPHDPEDVRRVVRDFAAKDVAKDAAQPTASAATRTWRDLVRAPRVPIQYHWDGWIPLAAVALLVGAGETYKSWLALMLAVMTAAGRALFARDGDTPIRQGPVLYITGENAIEEEARRCQLLQAALGLPEDLPITFLPASALNLSDETDYRTVRTLVETLRPVLITVDSAIAVSGVTEEKDNNAVRVFMKTRVLPFARQFGATVVVIGHSPKPPQQPGAQFTDEHVARGAGDWRNAADVVLYLRRDAALGPAAVILRHAKVRIGQRHTPVWFTLDEPTPGAARLTLGGTYDEVSAQASGALAKAIGGALEILRATPGLFVGDLLTQLAGRGTTKATARRAVGVLRGLRKHTWPYGRLGGQVFGVVDEATEGRRVRLVLDPTRVEQALPTSEDGDPA